MSVLDELRSDFSEGVSNAKGWLVDLEDRVPKVLDEAAKEVAAVKNEPIVAAALKLKGGKFADAALNLLTDLAKLAEQDLGGSSTPTAASTPEVGEPDRATVEQIAQQAGQGQPGVPLAPAGVDPHVVQVGASQAAPGPVTSAG